MSAFFLFTQFGVLPVYLSKNVFLCVCTEPSETVDLLVWKHTFLLQ